VYEEIGILDTGREGNPDESLRGSFPEK